MLPDSSPFAFVATLFCATLALLAPASTAQSPDDESAKVTKPQARLDPVTQVQGPAPTDLKLPKFQSETQQYRRLIFGLQDPKPLVWLVVDGNDVLCDINRNGDLTEPGERQSFEGKTVSFEGDGITVWYNKNLLKAKYDGVVQGALFGKSGKTPQAAPYFHIAGPLAVLKDFVRNRLGTKMDDFLVYTHIGTEYPGVQRTELRYECLPARIVPRIRLFYGDGSHFDHLLKSRC